MKWFLLFLTFVNASRVKVIHCNCNKLEEYMQSALDESYERYITHSLIYNQLLNTCVAAITFESLAPSPMPMMHRLKYVPP